MPKSIPTARRRIARCSLLLALLPALALAQQPPNLEPLPDVPPPPKMEIDPDAEPVVTVTKHGEDKVEEYRIKGKLYMIRVTPPHGVPYLLIDRAGNGEFGPVGGPSDSGNLSVPMWVIGTF
jgi:hypothetical protein